MNYNIKHIREININLFSSIQWCIVNTENKQNVVRNSEMHNCCLTDLKKNNRKWYTLSCGYSTGQTALSNLSDIKQLGQLMNK
jgi:hypothetical protein